MASKLSLSFRIFNQAGSQLVREEKLSLGVIKIGKVPSAHLRVDDETVSRMHAIIEVTGEDVALIDLGSTAGTFVNGQKINKAKLRAGDAIQVGNTRIELAAITPVDAPVVALPVATPAPVAAVATAPTVMASSPKPPVLPKPVTPVAVVPPPMPAPRPVAPLATATASSPLVTSAASPAAFAAAMSHDLEEGGARAVEVAAMLGDSVINVKHCMDPRSGKVTQATWGLIAGGLLCLAASASAFYIAVENAAYNKSSLDYHTNVLHKPEYSYRPRTISSGVDVVAFGGLGLALGCLTAGLARVRRERRSPYFRIGTAAGVEQPIEQAPAPAFPLVAPMGDDFVFNFGAGMDGELTVDGTSTPLSQLASLGRARPSAVTAGAIEVPIPPRARIRAKTGQATFLVSAVAKPREHAAPLFAGLETRTLAYIGGSLAAHLIVWAFLQTIPPEEGGVAQQQNGQEDLTLLSRINAQDDALPPDPEKSNEDDGVADGAQNDGGGRAMELEGDAGKPNATTTGRVAIQNNHIDPQLARQRAIEEAKRAGVLGSTEVIEQSIRTLTAIGDLSSGNDDSNIYGGVYGQQGEDPGNFGAGVKGPGGGGGCWAEPCGTIGTGRYKTIGPGDGPGPGGWKFGHGNGGLRTHIAQTPVTFDRPTVVDDGIDKEIVKRYIKRNLPKIAYCYESELLARPGIEGDIQMTFLITGTGVVSSSNGQGFDPTVTKCVAQVIKNIEFPGTKSGGPVQVNYPFHFHPTGKQQ